MSETDGIVLTDELVKKMAPDRPDSGYKGTFGTCLITAGSEFMPGACVLACGAALRSAGIPGPIRTELVFSRRRPAVLSTPVGMPSRSDCSAHG